MGKIAWVILPLLVYGLYLLATVARGRALKRVALNVQTSVLLMLYVLTTAGLGIFWVANQQLPAFDLHYLFGYATLLLIVVHLSFNLRAVLRHLRPKRLVSGAADGRVRSLLPWFGGAGLVALAFFLGMRHGRSEMRVSWGGGAGAVEAVQRYHEVSSHSRRGVFGRAPSAVWGARPDAFLRYPGRPTVALPTPDRVPHAGRSLGVAVAGPEQRRSPTLARLATVLWHGAGVTLERGGYHLRASPSSGGLFPSELYLVTDGIEGLQRGVYHYDAREHRLVQLGSEFPRPSALGGEAPAWIVLTSIFRRTGFKYGDRAFRYAAADAGHLLENLRLAAVEVGLEPRPAARYDDRAIARSLGIDGVEHGVMALCALDPTEMTPLPAARRFAEAAPDKGKVAGIGVTAMVHAATGLVALEPVAPEPEPQLLDLPAAGAAPGAVLQVIARRRSERRYSKEPLAAAELSGLLHDSAAVPWILSDAVRLYVVANRVEGVEHGVYRYHVEKGRLEQRRRGDMAKKARAAALAQDVIGDAAAVFVFTADRQRLFAREGARGYRQAFLETGMMGERLLLSAVARGLAACPVGAFYDDEAAELVGAEHEWALHFAAVGRQ